MARAPFPAGRLREQIGYATARALEAGALQSLETERVDIDEGGMRFEVRILSSLRRRHAQRSPATGNPFLPYDDALYVCELDARYLGLLNKYNVMASHLLAVTRRFEPQENPLPVEDLGLLSRLLEEYPSLGFYNGGPEAGASQPHRHLQLIPLDPAADSLPIDRWLAQGAPLPFRQHLLRGLSRDPARRAEAMWRCYREGIDRFDLAREDGRLKPHNLLVTRDWMLVVPRTAESAAGVSVNALGFAGLMLVRNRQQLDRLRAHGLRRALAEVSGRGESAP